MNQKWNLQDIRPAVTQKAVPREISGKRPQQDIAPRPTKIEVPEVADADVATIDVIDERGAKRKRVIITVIVAAILFGVGFGVNLLLGGATITVHPKVKDISVQASFTAHAKPQADELGYDLLTFEETGERQVKASGKEKVSEPAAGKIFVYNSKSAAQQKLIKNTRFESKDGLVYRIKESIEVPGVTKDAKGNTVPGSVVADVFSDGTGEQYNIQPGRFTVPGLKGSDQYDNVYGESTAAFTGGFEGDKYIIDEKELETAKQALHVELRDKLLAELKEKRPADFVIYDQSVAVVFDSLPSTEYGESLATIKEKGRLEVPIFKKDEFAQFLAKKTIPEYTGDPVAIINPEALTFTYALATTTVSDLALYSNLDFVLKGSTKVVWKYDQDKLLNELVGVKESQATNIFSTYTGISNARAELRPFWATTFPSDKKRIHIETVTDSEKK